MNRNTAVVADACSAGSTGQVVTVDIAAAKAIAVAKPVRETERLPLLEASGRVLAGECRSPMDLPPFDTSAMDGYAVRSGEFRGNGPWRFTITDRVMAGEGRLPAAERGSAIRIFTGAPVPEEFDTVVMQEQCERIGDDVIIAQAPRPGKNVRRGGEDVRRHDRLVEPGDALSAQALALLAGTGIAEVDVFRKVRVGLISTGSELREPGEALGPGQIFNSNRILLRSMLDSYRWAETVDFGIVPDSRARLVEALGNAVKRCDVLVTTGGVSAGEEDHVSAVLKDAGASLEIVKVAMRPGKPLKIGLVGGTLFAGLPGNPKSTLVTFRQIALPAIRAMAGLRNAHPEWQPAISGFDYAKKPGRTEFVPVRVAGHTDSGIPVVEMLGRGSSASLSAMAAADGIALLPPETEAVGRGMQLRFEWIGG
jgi:molybdopterin molybdotransferase